MAIKVRSPFQDKDMMKLEDFLRECGAHEKRHLDGSLMAHLVRTYEILKAADAPVEVCLAGGLHSLYGTANYHDACLLERSVIRERFGQTVETLVYQFSRWRSEPPSTESALIAMQCANLRDQETLKDNQTLQKFWDEYRGKDKA